MLTNDINRTQLNKNSRKKLISSKRRAFTLVELLFILVIMSILMMVTLPKFGRFLSSYNVKEARYNHQTLVYSIREWSLNNKDHKIVPNSFTVKNTQGHSVSDYLKIYNNEYYVDYLKPRMSGGKKVKISRIEDSKTKGSYEFKDGKMVTTIVLAKNETKTFVYDPLNGISTSSRSKYLLQ